MLLEAASSPAIFLLPPSAPLPECLIVVRACMPLLSHLPLRGQFDAPVSPCPSLKIPDSDQLSKHSDDMPTVCASEPRSACVPCPIYLNFGLSISLHFQLVFMLQLSGLIAHLIFAPVCRGTEGRGRLEEICVPPPRLLLPPTVQLLSIFSILIILMFI